MAAAQQRGDCGLGTPGDDRLNGDDTQHHRVAHHVVTRERRHSEHVLRDDTEAGLREYVQRGATQVLEQPTVQDAVVRLGVVADICLDRERSGERLLLGLRFVRRRVRGDRRGRCCADGSWRTTALFAMTDDDWPTIAPQLETRTRN